MGEYLYPALLIVIILGIMFGVTVVASYFWLRYLDSNFRQCPKCETRGSGTIIDTIDLGSHTEIDFSRTPPQKITTHKVEDHYKCENCSHTWTRTLNEITREKHKVQTSR